METRVLTVMFTDLKGFTERTSTQSRDELNYLLDTQDTLIRPIIEKYGGTIVKTIGDAFMVTFESPTNAVHCGVDIQDALREHNTDTHAEHQLHLRMGINSGEVSLKNGDVFGEPVNIASRIEGIAEPGEVYFTDSVYLAMNKNEIPSAEVGKRHLKGIAEMVTVYKVLREKGALDQHLARRKAAVMVTGKLDKHGEIKSAVAWGKRRLTILLGVIVLVFALIALWSLNRVNKKAPTVAPLPQKTLQQINTKAPLPTSIKELSPVERRILQQRLEQKINR